jgi:hypothetical protein
MHTWSSLPLCFWPLEGTCTYVTRGHEALSVTSYLCAKSGVLVITQLLTSNALHSNEYIHSTEIFGIETTGLTLWQRRTVHPHSSGMKSSTSLIYPLLKIQDVNFIFQKSRSLETCKLDPSPWHSSKVAIIFPIAAADNLISTGNRSYCKKS